MEKTMKLSQRGPVVATASIVSVKQEDNALVKPATSAAASDLSLVKEISEKLKLATRRPSVVQWKQVIEDRKLDGQYAAQSKVRFLDTHLAEELSEKHETATSSCGPPVGFLTPQHSCHSSENSEEKQTKTRRTGQGGTPPGAGYPFPAPLTASLHLRTKSASAVERESLDRRYRKVQEQLDTLRHDLILMRLQDNKLARVLLDTRRQLNRARAHKSCDEHAEMLDDVAWELEEEEELTGLYKACDLPDRKPAFLMSVFSPLLHIGVSKMNLNERRFSIR